MVMVSHHIHNPGNIGGVLQGTFIEIYLLYGPIFDSTTFLLRVQERNGAGVQTLVPVVTGSSGVRCGHQCPIIGWRVGRHDFLMRSVSVLVLFLVSWRLVLFSWRLCSIFLETVKNSISSNKFIF